ncbi:MAG: PaaI family thioesterase [Thaumarchaeota archaeon]|nr:PaaI family thioesterase [Nitrososphaerota archaeon]
MRDGKGGAVKAKEPSAKGNASVVLRSIRQRIKDGTKPPIAKLVGFTLTRVGPGWAWVEMDAGPEHANPMGTLHGGIFCDIADAAMGMSFASLLEAEDSFTTIEIKVNFLRPFWSGHLIAKGRMLKKGRSLGLAECRVVDEHGRLVAYATSTCMTVLAAKGGEMKRERLDRTGH